MKELAVVGDEYFVIGTHFLSRKKICTKRKGESLLMEAL